MFKCLRVPFLNVQTLSFLSASNHLELDDRLRVVSEKELWLVGVSHDLKCDRFIVALKQVYWFTIAMVLACYGFFLPIYLVLNQIPVESCCSQIGHIISLAEFLAIPDGLSSWTRLSLWKRYVPPEVRHLRRVRIRLLQEFQPHILVLLAQHLNVCANEEYVAEVFAIYFIEEVLFLASIVPDAVFLDLIEPREVHFDGWELTVASVLALGINLEVYVGSRQL